MALAWKACWVNALASSNLASSAINPTDSHESVGFFILLHETGVIEPRFSGLEGYLGVGLLADWRIIRQMAFWPVCWSFQVIDPIVYLTDITHPEEAHSVNPLEERHQNQFLNDVAYEHQHAE